MNIADNHKFFISHYYILLILLIFSGVPITCYLQLYQVIIPTRQDSSEYIIKFIFIVVTIGLYVIHEITSRFTDWAFTGTFLHSMGPGIVLNLEFESQINDPAATETKL